MRSQYKCTGLHDVYIPTVWSCRHHEGQCTLIHQSGKPNDLFSGSVIRSPSIIVSTFAPEKWIQLRSKEIDFQPSSWQESAETRWGRQVPCSSDCKKPGSVTRSPSIAHSRLPLIVKSNNGANKNREKKSQPSSYLGRRVLELAGVDKARALAIAKENGLLNPGTLTRSPSVVQSPADAGKPGRRRQRSLGGTRASRRYNFWQVRAQV